MKIVSLFLVLNIFLSCGKTNDSSSLVGKWKLIATLADPGDGSGRWQPVSEYAHIQLYADGRVTSHNFTDYKKYQVIDSVRIELTLPDDTKVNFRYRLNGSLLELNPPCIEPCGSKFVKLD